MGLKGLKAFKLKIPIKNLSPKLNFEDIEIQTVVPYWEILYFLKTLPAHVLLPAVHEEQHLTTENIPFRDSVEVQSVYSWFLSTLSFWLHYSLLSETQGMNKCIIGVIYFGGRVKRIVYS